jgi:hypothetical protein
MHKHLDRGDTLKPYTYPRSRPRDVKNDDDPKLEALTFALATIYETTFGKTLTASVDGLFKIGKVGTFERFLRRELPLSGCHAKTGQDR